MIDNRLEKIKKIQESDLLNPDIISNTEDLCADYVNGSRVGEAQELWVFLSKLINGSKIKTLNLSFYLRYNEVLDKLAWIAYIFMPDLEVERLYKSRLLFGLSNEFDIKGKVKLYFNLAFGDLLRLNQRRNLIINALRSNEEYLGRQDLNITNLNEKLPPMIKNWLRDYDQSSQTEKRMERLGIVEYFNASRNIRQLSESQKLYLRQILELYDLLRFLTATDDNLEITGHEIPSKSNLSNNLKPAEDIVNETSSNLLIEKEILAAYQGDARQQKMITGEEEKLKKAGKFKLREEFMAAVQDKNVNKTMAAFRVLARSGDLGSFLKEDAKLNKFMAGVWEKKFNKALAAEFIKNADQLKFVRLFLRYILEERLGLGTSDAARLGLQLGNIFVNLGKKEYNKIAYYDVGSKGFKWFEE